MINKEEEALRLSQEKTDELLPRAWKSGSLKYDELKPLSEGELPNFSLLKTSTCTEK